MMLRVFFALLTLPTFMPAANLPDFGKLEQAILSGQVPEIQGTERGINYHLIFAKATPEVAKMIIGITEEVRKTNSGIPVAHRLRFEATGPDSAIIWMHREIHGAPVGTATPARPIYVTCRADPSEVAHVIVRNLISMSRLLTRHLRQA